MLFVSLLENEDRGLRDCGPTRESRSGLRQSLQIPNGKSFVARNLRRMMQFAEQFPDSRIVSPLATQLSWPSLLE
jgi:hypothetical protein